MSIDNLIDIFFCIASDDLRDKLSELSEKCKDFSSSTSNMYALTSKLNFVNSSLRDILNLIYNDSDFNPEFSSAMTDLSVCFSVIFRNDFSNNLLPNVFYSNLTNTLGAGGALSSVNQFSRLQDIDLISGALFNANYIQLVNETITQRPIFTLIKELINTNNQSQERESLIHLLVEMCSKQNRIGYYFLYYIYSIMIKVKLVDHLNSNSSSQAYRSSSNELNIVIRIYKEFMNERNSCQTKNTIISGIGANNGGGSKENMNTEYEKVSSSSSSSVSSSSSSSSNDEQDEADSENEMNEKRLNESEINLGDFRTYFLIKNYFDLLILCFFIYQRQLFDA